MLTLLTLPPTAIALIELGYGAPRLVVAAVTILSLGALVYGVGPRVRLGFADAPRSWLVGAVALPLFDVAWCASLLSPITTGGVALAAFPLALLGTAPPGVVSLRVVARAGVAFSLVAAAYGVFVRRRWVRVRKVTVDIPDLPSPFEGYRIAHLSDLHVGSLTRASQAERWKWVTKTNALDVDIVAVTGDLISTGLHFHDEAARVIGAFRGHDGVFACLGNHDYYDVDRLCALLGDRGVRVLRNEGVTLTRGAAHLEIAGVEDLWRGNVDLEAALVGRPAGAPVVLLAHNPDFFDRAAVAGVSLMLAGHTHAGQIALPFLVERAGLAHLAARYAAGVFRKGGSRLFVTAGLGTTGPAIRLGAAPEIVEITLRRDLRGAAPT